jgi:HK97 family phage prohead protease
LPTRYRGSSPPGESPRQEAAPRAPAIAARGIRPPFAWSHQWSDPDAYLGPITGLRETAKGLEVDFEITSPSETAKQVEYLLREGLVTQMSFAYNVWDEQRAKDGSTSCSSKI